jgi:uncharacterized repeat protein (TIGR01451 family)
MTSKKRSYRINYQDLALAGFGFVLMISLVSIYYLGQDQMIKGAAALPLSGPVVVADSLPLTILKADLNNDALADYISSELNQFKVYLNNGSGYTLSQTIYENVLPNSELKSGRVNADTYLDLVLISGNQLKIFINDGSGNFDDPQSVTIPGAIALSVGKFDADNLLDVAGISSGNFFILHGAGTGAFNNQNNFSGLANQKSIAAGDYNADGLDDLAIVGDSLQVYLNTGADDFVAGVNYQTSGLKLVSADFNNDNLPDLAFINNKLIVYVNKGDASFVLLGIYDGSATIWQSGTAVFSCDYNYDGLWDIGAVFNDQRKVYQNLNNPFITYIAPGAVFAGATDFTLKVYGSGFVANSVVRYNGTDKATTYVNSNELTVPISAADVNTVSTNDITVYNATQNAESSASFLYVEPGFYDPQKITTGSSPKSGFSADFNNDEIPDLAVVNSGSNNVSIFLGHGDGLFVNADPATVAVGTGPSSIVGGDFNGDQNIDLAVANYGSNNIKILAGNGSGGFTSIADYGTGTQPTDVVIADYNNDTFLDLIVANSGSNNLSVFSGNGSGGFSLAETISVGTQPRALQAIDITADGFIDIVTANYGSNNISVFTGDGSGVFFPASPAIVIVGSQPVDLAIADYNSDNLPDCLVVNSGSNTVSVLLGYGTGSFAAASPATFNTDLKPQAIISQNFNDDNYLDLAVANYDDDSIIMIFGNGDGTFGRPISYTLEDKPIALINGDFNLDGRLDLAAVNYGGNSVSILLKKVANNTALFEAQTDYPVGDWPKGLASGDLNNDGKNDIAIANTGSNNVSILLNDGDGTFTEAASSPITVGDLPNIVTITDMNGDTKNDLIVGNRNDINFTIILGNGDGSFQQAETLSFGISPYAVASADLNNDGNQDFVIANGGEQDVNYVTVVLGNGDGTFAGPQNFTADLWPRKLVIADFDNDNIIDIVTINYPFAGNTISFLKGIGDGSFGAPITFSAPADSQNLISQDVNNDNYLDLIVSRYVSGGGGDPECEMFNCYDPFPPPMCSMFDCTPLSGNGIFVLLGNGDGTFSASVSYGDLMNSNVLASADFNGDNYADLVAASFDQNQLLILNNNGNGTYSNGSTYTVSGGPIYAAIKDLNNDNNQDIVIAQQNDRSVTILFGDGSGAFGSPLSISLNINPTKVQVGDIDGDTNYDLVVSSTASQSIVVISGNGDGTFDSPRYFVSPVQPMGLTVSDFNNDSFVDVLSVTLAMTANTGLLLNNGDGTFPTTYNYDLGSFGGSFLTRDFNNDGYKDLVVGLEGATTFKVLLGSGDLSFSAPVDYDAGCNPQYTTSADFNNDQKLDLAVSNYCSHTIDVFFGNGDGSFITPPDNYVIPGQPQPQGILNADFNGDGILDLATANNYGASVSVLLGVGDGTFSTASFSNVYYATNDQINGDFNADGHQDLAVLNDPNYLSILLGKNDSTFFPPIDYFVGHNPQGVISDDFNGDARPDLAVTNYFDNAVSVFLGQIAVPDRHRSHYFYAPISPGNLTCKAVDSTSIIWSFDDNSTDEHGFRLYDKENTLIVTAEQEKPDVRALTEKNLLTNTKYESRHVAAYNSQGNSAPSNDASCFTLANEPLSLRVMKSPSELKLILNNSDGNPAGTEYAIFEYYSNKYLHDDGKLYSEAQWKTYSGWNGANGVVVKEVLSLYDYFAFARNGDGVISGLTPAGLFLTCEAVSPTEINWQLRTPLNWEKDGYDLYQVQSEEIFDLLSAIKDSGNRAIYFQKELTPNSPYSAFFTTYKISNTDTKNESLASNTEKCFTLANEPLPVIIGEVTEDSVQIILDNHDGNPAETLYALYEAKSGKYVQADGSLGSEPFWQTYASWGGASGIYVSILTTPVPGQVSLSANLDLSQFDFVAKVKNGDNIVTVEPELTNVSISKAAAVNIVRIENTLFGKIAAASNGFEPQSVAMRLIQEFSFLLNIMLLILVLLLAYNVYASYIYLYPANKIIDKFSYLTSIFSKEPAILFSRLSAKDNNGVYTRSFHKQKISHQTNRKLLKGALGVLMLKFFTLAIMIFGLIGIQYAGNAQDVIYSQDPFDIKVSDKLSYIIHFANDGTNPAQSVVISDNLNPNLKYMENSAKVTIGTEEVFDSFSQDASLPNNLSFNLGVLDAGQSGTVTFDAQVLDSAIDQQITNEAKISGDNFDPKVSNSISNSVKTDQILIEEKDETLEKPVEELLEQIPIPSIGGSIELPVTEPISELVEGQEVNYSIFGSFLNIFTEDVSKTQIVENILSSISQNETVKTIVESAPVKFVEEKVLNNPVVEQTSQSVVTPALVTVAVINTAPAFATASLNFWSFLHFLFVEPLLILFRKKRKNWGVVYDSLTKMPISLALVRLYRKEDRRLVQTRVTDREGRYLIMVKDPGLYYLEVTKPNYDYPSKILSTEKMDTKYLDLYHGEELNIQDKEASISANIPLDVRDVKVKPISAVIRSFALQNLKNVISYVGLILALLVLIIYPSIITILALVFHLIFYVIFKKLLVPAKPKGWGIVYDEQNKQALNNVVVRLFDIKFNKLLETQLTDNKGRYAFLVGKNVYQMMLEKDGYQSKEVKPVDLTAAEQLVNLDVALAKLDKTPSPEPAKTDGPEIPPTIEESQSTPVIPDQPSNEQNQLPNKPQIKP